MLLHCDTTNKMFILFLLTYVAFVASEDNFLKNSTTFKVCDKIPEKYYYEDEKPDSNRNLLLDTVRTKEIVAELNQCKKNNCTEYLHGTTFSSRSQPSRNNGFVNTVVQSYNGHHNLIIRPDDVWLQIMVQFSFYINYNAEEFRGKFVDCKGKKDLIVSLPGTLESAPYDKFVKLMSQKIHENILDKQFKNWILPNFTTTTYEDEVTSGVVFMATMKKYFSYVFNLACGIPSITLEGTVEDWLEILSRLENLKQYKLEKWYDLLEPVLQQFVAAKRGNPDLDFWKRIVHRSGGSGPNTISGWITVFCVFDAEGKWQAKFHIKEHFVERDSYETAFFNSYSTWPVIKMPNIPSGIVEANVTIITEVRNYSSVLLGGHMAFEVLDDETTLKPLIGWAIVLTNNNSDPVNSVNNHEMGLNNGPLETSGPEHQKCEMVGNCESAMACNPEVEFCDVSETNGWIGVTASCSVCIPHLFLVLFSLLATLKRHNYIN